MWDLVGNPEFWFSHNEAPLSLVIRNLSFFICDNNIADYRAADQCHCFHFTDSTIPLLPNSEILSIYMYIHVSFVNEQPGLLLFLYMYMPVCVKTWSKTLKTGFLMTRLNC